MIRQTIILIMLIISCVFASATIIVYENFENYTTHTPSTHPSLFFNESGGLWDCLQVDPTFNCFANYGTANGDTEYSIDADGSNNYLTTSSLGGVDGGHKILDIEWTFDTPSSPLGNSSHNYTIRYSYRLNEYQAGASNYTFDIQKERVYSQVTFANSIANSEFIKFDNVSNYLAITQGGAFYTGMDDINHARLRSKDGSQSALPDTNISTDCDITPNVWTDIEVKLEWDSNQNLTSAKTYIDGTLCSTHSQTDAGIYTNSSIPLSHLIIRTSAVFNASYDDFIICEGSECEIPVPNITYVKHTETDFGLPSVVDFSSMTYMGDMDSDGNTDIVIGTDSVDTGTGGFMFVDLYPNGSVEDFFIYNVSNFPYNLTAPDSLGTAMDNIGDWDGNGVDDLVVSLHGENMAGTDFDGLVFLIEMESNYSIKDYTVLSSLEGMIDNNSRSTFDRFGLCLTNLGDIDNDGVNDIAVSRDGIGLDESLYILRMNSDFTVKGYNVINDTDFNGTPITYFGINGCNGVGDANGDGVEDIVVSGGTIILGRLWLFNLNTDGTIDSTESYNPDDYGMGRSGTWGTGGEGGTDFNNDAVDDWVVGMPDNEYGANYVSIMLMNSDLTVNDTLILSNGAVNDDFGGSTTTLGDLNNDGFEDIAVGTSEAGDLYIYFLNITPLGITQNVTNVTYQCDDGLDNDGDTFTDYPADPSCSSLTDDTEAPFDTTECSDGVDNDADTYIDFPADPSCDSASDNTESPADLSQQAEDECLASQYCLLYDTIPYDDLPNLHGWYGDLVESDTEEIYGGQSILLDTITGGFKQNVVAKKNITNPNNYDLVSGEVVLSFLENASSSVSNELFAIAFEDYDQNNIATIILNISTITGSIYDGVAEVYASDGTTLIYIGNLNIQTADQALFRFNFEFDENANTYDLTATAVDSSVTALNYGYFNGIASGKINTAYFVNQIQTNEMEVYLHSVFLEGNLDSVTECNEYALPYFIRESFNGYPQLCDWLNQPEIYFFGEASITKADGDYVQQKYFDEVAKAENLRYLTVAYDFNIINVTTGSSINLRLYDEDDFNFWSVYYRDSGEDLWYNDDGTGKVAQAGIPLNQTYNYKFVIDFQDDKFDIYYNGSKILADAGLTQNLYNLKSAERFKFHSSDSAYKVDNLDIYASDADGVPLLPDSDTGEIVNEDESMCGLFINAQVNCLEDDDCATGECLPTNKCARFDFNYCDDNSMTRGNKCMIAGVLDCTLESTKDIIIDNFFKFLVFLVLLMGVVYLVIIITRQRQGGR